MLDVWLHYSDMENSMESPRGLGGDKLLGFKSEMKSDTSMNSENDFRGKKRCQMILCWMVRFSSEII